MNTASAIHRNMVTDSGFNEKLHPMPVPSTIILPALELTWASKVRTEGADGRCGRKVLATAGAS